MLQVTPDDDLAIGEGGDETRQRIIQRQTALLHQHQYRHRGDRFRHRVDAEDTVFAHEPLTRQIHMPPLTSKGDTAIHLNQSDGAWIATSPSGVLEEAVQALPAIAGLNQRRGETQQERAPATHQPVGRTRDRAHDGRSRVYQRNVYE